MVILIGLSVFMVILFSIMRLSSNLSKGNISYCILKLSMPFLVLLGLLNWLVNVKEVNFCVLISPMILAIMTMYMFPFLYYLTNKGSGQKFFWVHDFEYGLYVSIMVLCIQIITGHFIKQPIICSAINGMIIVIFSIPSMFLLSYWLLYKKVIDFNTVQTIFYTTKREAYEWYLSINLKSIIMIMLLCATLVGGMLVWVRDIAINIESYNEILTIVLIFFIVSFIVFRKNRGIVFRTGLGNYLSLFKDYQKQLDCYRTNHKENVLNFNMKSDLPEKFGTIILVVGESANRDYMSSFSDYCRETTPWLDGNLNNDNFYYFHNSYSTHTQTATTIPLALTNANQYNKMLFSETVTIIDIANECGFKTFWFSNQNIVDSSSTPSSMIADSAYLKRWILEDYPCVQYDEKLLEYFKLVPNDESNKFIVFHLKGSHIDFNCRYPKNFEKWPVKPGDRLGQNPYDNSILYTDFVLKEIYDYAMKHLNLQAMVYFSDHGTEIGVKRSPHFDSFKSVRIPFFVWLSDKYKEIYPETAQNLSRNKEKYFVNDYIFDFFMGIFQVTSEKINKTDDICSGLYTHTKDTLFTDLGRVCLADEEYYETNKNL